MTSTEPPTPPTPPTPPKLTDPSDLAQLDAYSRYVRERRMWAKSQERAYAIPGLDVPWWSDQARPLRVWEAGPGPVIGAIAAGPHKGFNGYVLLPPNHPWREIDLQDPPDDFESPAVPGGITFGPHVTGWIGFDTAHAGDEWDWDLLEDYHAKGWVPDETWQRWQITRRIDTTVAAQYLHKHASWCHHWNMGQLELAVEALALQVHLTTPSGEKK